MVAALLGIATAFWPASACAQQPSAGTHPMADIGQLQANSRGPADRGTQSSVAGAQNLEAHDAAPDRLNPLWDAPIASFAPTRERPIFSPSRRPAIAALPPPVQLPPAPSQQKPRKPPFVLLGAIEGENEQIALLLEETTKAVVRLRAGQSHSGWTLRTVKGSEAVLQGYQQTATLVVPNRPTSSSQTPLNP
jgi:general secretion pathway protein N